MQYLLLPIAFIIFIFFFRYVVVFLSVSKSRLQYGSFQLEKPDPVPAYLKQLFKIPISELETFGFQPCGYLCVENVLILPPPQNWEVLLFNKAEKTYARLGINRPVEPFNLFDIQFLTFFTNRTMLLTINGKAQGIFGDLPNTTLQDGFVVQLSEQWELHCQALRQCQPEKAPCVLTPQACARALQAYQIAYIDSLARKKAVLPVPGTPTFRFAPQAAFSLTRQMFKSASKADNILKQRRQLAKTDSTFKVEIPLELEVEGFLRAEEINEGLVGQKFRTWILLGSFALFVFFATKSFPSYSWIIFVAAICLHEGGHILAMKLSGYRDTNVLFVPFLGALATARQREDATLVQKFWILLAGPLPGLILGLVLALAIPNVTAPSWLILTAWVLIALNLFNLLPIYPLDGGQIADMLLFSRIPYLGVFFKGIGVIILAWIALGLEKPLFLMFALLIAISIPNSFRRAKIMAKLRGELAKTPFENRHTLLMSIYQHLKRLGYASLPYSTRYTLAKNIIQDQHDFRSQGLARLGLIVLYIGSLLGGITATVAAAMPGFQHILPVMFSSPEQRRAYTRKIRQEKLKSQINQANTALQANPKDLKAYRKRASAKLGLGDEAGAQADYDSIITIAPKDVSSWLDRARFYKKIKNTQGAFDDYTQALRLDPKNIEIYHLRARVRTRLGDRRGAMSDYNSAIKLNPNYAESYIMRASARQEFGDAPGALADYNFALQLDPNNPDIYALRSELHRQLGNEAGALADEQKAEQLYLELDKEN